jgi:hypothetical protein
MPQPYPLLLVTLIPTPSAEYFWNGGEHLERMGLLLGPVGVMFGNELPFEGVRSLESIPTGLLQVYDWKRGRLFGPALPCKKLFCTFWYTDALDWGVTSIPGLILKTGSIHEKLLEYYVLSCWE